MLTSVDVVYLDSSAIVKLVLDETESPDLAAYLRQRPTRLSCALARVEVVLASRPRGSAFVARAREVLDELDLLLLDDTLLDLAADIDLPGLRSLDAIHLAAALTLRSRLAALVTYDQRMARSANALGLTVAAPGRSAG